MKKKITYLFLLAGLFFLLITTGFENWQNITTNLLINNPAITLPTPTTNTPLIISSPIPTIVKPLTIDNIFAPDHDWIQKLPPTHTLVLITTGDVMPGRTVNYLMESNQDFDMPFASTSAELKKADLTLINLESPLTKNCPVTQTGMTFCANERFAEGLNIAGIDVINLANNHTYNYGIEGFVNTRQLLVDDFLVTGDPQNNLCTTTVKGMRIGFLGYNLLTDWDDNKLLNEVYTAKKNVDVLVVSLHWGIEYTRQPTTDQRHLAYRIIDEGAELVVGNHPHWMQSLEVYKQKLIVYSHGNFVFDQEWSEETKTGLIAKHTFFDNVLIDTEIMPVYITDYNRPSFMTGSQKEQTLDHLKKISYFNNL